MGFYSECTVYPAPKAPPPLTPLQRALKEWDSPALDQLLTAGEQLPPGIKGSLSAAYSRAYEGGSPVDEITRLNQCFEVIFKHRGEPPVDLWDAVFWDDPYCFDVVFKHISEKGTDLHRFAFSLQQLLDQTESFSPEQLRRAQLLIASDQGSTTNGSCFEVVISKLASKSKDSPATGAIPTIERLHDLCSYAIECLGKKSNLIPPLSQVIMSAQYELFQAIIQKAKTCEIVLPYSSILAESLLANSIAGKNRSDREKELSPLMPPYAEMFEFAFAAKPDLSNHDYANNVAVSSLPIPIIRRLVNECSLRFSSKSVDNALRLGRYDLVGMIFKNNLAVDQNGKKFDPQSFLRHSAVLWSSEGMNIEALLCCRRCGAVIDDEFVKRFVISQLGVDKSGEIVEKPASEAGAGVVTFRVAMDFFRQDVLMAARS